LQGEIVSVDSMQVYRGLNIGSAKPSAADQARVPHHLLDVVDVTEPFDAAHFVTLARKAILEIQGRGRVPILCGGTGLYFKAYLEGLGESPPAQPALRAELEAMPLVELLDELANSDPATFQSIDHHNSRRVIRAVEVIRLSGKPFSAQRAPWSAFGVAPSGVGCRLPVIMSRTRADLLARIDRRVQAMFDQGLVEETKQLLEQGLDRNRTAMQAIGYRQVVEFLRGDRSLPETVDLVKLRTRQYGKRQVTWFKHKMTGTTLHCEVDESAATVAQTALSAVSQTA
jgi:tRNA dimethylallyltransferase